MRIVCFGRLNGIFASQNKMIKNCCVLYIGTRLFPADPGIWNKLLPFKFATFEILLPLSRICRILRQWRSTGKPLSMTETTKYRKVKTGINYPHPYPQNRGWWTVWHFSVNRVLVETDIGKLWPVFHHTLMLVHSVHRILMSVLHQACSIHNGRNVTEPVCAGWCSLWSQLYSKH